MQPFLIQPVGGGGDVLPSGELKLELSDSIQGAAPGSSKALRAEAVLGPELLFVLGCDKAFLTSVCFSPQVDLGVHVVRFSREEFWARCKTCIGLRKWLLSYR